MSARIARLRPHAEPVVDFEQYVCESCDEPATVRLADGSMWCHECNASAIALGYDDEDGERFTALGAHGRRT